MEDLGELVKLMHISKSYLTSFPPAEKSIPRSSHNGHHCFFGGILDWSIRWGALVALILHFQGVGGWIWKNVHFSFFLEGTQSSLLIVFEGFNNRQLLLTQFQIKRWVNSTIVRFVKVNFNQLMSTSRNFYQPWTIGHENLCVLTDDPSVELCSIRPFL